MSCSLLGVTSTICSRSASSVSGRRLVSIDRKSTRLNSSHTVISYAVFCLISKALASFVETDRFRASQNFLAINDAASVTLEDGFPLSFNNLTDLVTQLAANAGVTDLLSGL